MSDVRRAAISLLDECSNACVFCAEGRASEAAPSIEALYAQGAREITIGGGEPTLAPERLVETVRMAREVGFGPIVVQTNGHALAPLVPALVEAGLTVVHLSVHGTDARAHDYHTGREGSFERLWDAAAAAHHAGLRVIVTTVITRSSYRTLAALALMLRARGVAAWHLAVPIVRGRAQQSFDRVVPRLGMAMPFALHALETARRVGLSAYVSGAPLCLLGPFATRAIHTLEPAEARAFGERCTSCAARPSCVGLDPTYLARFDGDELRTRDAAPSPAESEPLASLFVGPIVLAPREEQPVHESTLRARRSLPMYGRPQRAQHEVATREAKSGEALREILPKLFEERPTREDEPEHS